MRPLKYSKADNIMNKTIVIMRHGEYNNEDMSLSENGREEVEATAKKLIAEKLIPQIILYSPVKRTLETAQQLQELFNRLADVEIELVENNNLHEHAGFKTTSVLSEDLDDKLSIVMTVTHSPNIMFLLNKIEEREPNINDTPETAEALIYESKTPKWSNINKENSVKKRIAPLLK